MENQPPRQEDWSDCITIAKFLFDRGGHALSPKLFTQFDDTSKEPPVFTRTIVALKQQVLRVHRQEMFPKVGWVYTTSKNTLEYKWLDGVGTPFDSSFKPNRTGVQQIVCIEEKQIKSFDFGKNAWEAAGSSAALKKDDSGDEEEDDDDGDEDEDDGEDDDGDNEED
jgi:hypothetical protein